MFHLVLLSRAIALPPDATAQVGRELGHFCQVRGPTNNRVVCITRDTPFPPSDEVFWDRVAVYDATSAELLWKHPVSPLGNIQEVLIDDTDQVWLDAYGELRRVHPKKGEIPTSLPDHPYPPSPSDVRFYVDPDGAVGVFYVDTLYAIEAGLPKKWHTPTSDLLGFHKARNQVFVGSDGVLEVRDIATGKTLEQYPTGDAHVYLQDVSPDGRWVGFGGFSDQRVVDRKRGTIVWQRKNDVDGNMYSSVFEGCFTQDGWWHPDRDAERETVLTDYRVYVWSFDAWNTPQEVVSPYDRNGMLQCRGGTVVSGGSFGMEPPAAFDARSRKALVPLYSPMQDRVRWDARGLVTWKGASAVGIHWPRTGVPTVEPVEQTDVDKPDWYALPKILNSVSHSPGLALADGTVFREDEDAGKVWLEKEGKTLWTRTLGPVWSIYLLRHDDQMLLLQLDREKNPGLVALDRETGELTGTFLGYPEENYAPDTVLTGGVLYLGRDGGYVSAHSTRSLETLWEHRVHTRQPKMFLQDGQVVSVADSAVFWKRP